MKQEILYTLTEPVKISKDGDYIDADNVCLYPPRPIDKYTVLALENGINNAVLSVWQKFQSISNKKDESKAVDDSKDSEDDASSLVRSALKIGADEALTIKIYESFTKILLANYNNSLSATISGEPLKQAHIDQIGYNDLRELLVRYVSNFLSVGL